MSETVLYSGVQKALRMSAKSEFTGKKPSLFLYGIVGILALLKDLLDFVLIGSLPAIGTAVTFCVAFFIWMLLTLFDESGGKENAAAVRRGMIQLLGAGAEGFVFGLNFLPIETIVVIVLYVMARNTWKQSAVK